MFSFNENIIRTSINTLHNDGDVFEIRLINGSYNASGYFDNVDSAISALYKFRPGFKKEELSKNSNIFITLNKVNDACMSRKQCNQIIENVQPTTSDDVIDAYNCLLIDLDPKRISGTSSSDFEVDLALKKSEEIKTFLASIGFHKMIISIISNGSGAFKHIFVVGLSFSIKYT